MKIVPLNTWGGRAGKQALLEFFETHQDVDVFCLQEIWSGAYEHLEGHAAGGLGIDHSNIMVHGLQDISVLLKNHNAYFKPHHLDNYGLLMFVKKNLTVTAEGDEFVHKERGFVPQGDAGLHARNVQFITLATESGNLSIFNFHGLWNGQGKGDSEDRLLQSDKIVGFLKKFPHPLILCGDFNLLPDTQSVKKLEDSGLQNLVIKHGVTSTRTSFYTKPEKFADYVFTSPEIEVKSFKVLPDEVSDHAALYLEIE